MNTDDYKFREDRGCGKIFWGKEVCSPDSHCDTCFSWLREHPGMTLNNGEVYHPHGNTTETELLARLGLSELWIGVARTALSHGSPAPTDVLTTIARLRDEVLSALGPDDSEGVVRARPDVNGARTKLADMGVLLKLVLR